MRRDKDVHDLLEELLSGLVVAEQSVSIHQVQLTFVRVRQRVQRVVIVACIEAKQVREPLFNGITRAIPDWFFQFELLQLSLTSVRSCDNITMLRTLRFLELLDQLERQRPASAFVAMDRGRQNDHIRSQQLLNKSDRNGSCLVDNQ